MKKYSSGRGRNRSEKPLVSLSPFTARVLSKAVPEHDWLNAPPILYPHQMATEEDGIPEGPWLGFDSGEDRSRTGSYFSEFDEYEETDYALIEQRILDSYEANPLLNPMLANAARHVQQAIARVDTGRLLEQFRETAQNLRQISFGSRIQRQAPADSFAQQAQNSGRDIDRMVRYAAAYGATEPQLDAIIQREVQREVQRQSHSAVGKRWIFISSYAKIPQDRELLVTAAKDLGCGVDSEYVFTQSAEQRERVLEAYELRRKNLGAGLPDPPRKVRRSIGGLPVIDEVDGAGRIARKAGKCN